MGDIPSVRCLHLLLLALCFLHTACGNAELRTLMEIKAGLDPENRVLGSWGSSGDHCGGTFEGVACNQHGKVANISLQGKGLSGEIPAAVANLKCLSGLYLHYNSLSGQIPEEISNLTELVDLYLNVNNLSASIPQRIGNMVSLQVLQLCCNQLSGIIPASIGSLKKLSVLALQHNRLMGTIPTSLGSLGMLRRLDLSFNAISDAIPSSLADLPRLEYINIQKNNLSGLVPPALKRLKDQFEFGNNFNLCGTDFASLRNCSTWDSLNLNLPQEHGWSKGDPNAADIRQHCRSNQCSTRSQFSRIVVIALSVGFAVAFSLSGFMIVIRYRRHKQKISSMMNASPGDQISSAQARKTPSSLIQIEYPFLDGKSCDLAHELCKFNVEDIESATMYFSEMNLLGKSKFSSVYRGTLRDGSQVAIRSLSVTSCKPEESEFAKGLSLLKSLVHDNLVPFRGFCCSRSRGECFLVYDFVPNGNLASYLDQESTSNRILDWSSRVSIIKGVADGIRYLHSKEMNKSALVHQNISAEKVLLDSNLKPLITDSGLPKLLADDAVFSALKVTAAMGYLAPEYITTGRFTNKSDVYAFGVIILQVLTGKQLLSYSIRNAAESCNFSDIIDGNLGTDFFETEAANLAELALLCTDVDPDKRPTMDMVVSKELNPIHKRRSASSQG